jgi:hypothetical protein
MWVESPFFDWYNGDLLKNLEGFVSLFIKYGNTNSANILRTIIDRKIVLLSLSLPLDQQYISF